MPDPIPAASAKRGIYYGWVVVAASLLMMSVTFSIQSSFGVFFIPLQESFGWSRATTSMAMTIHVTAYALGLLPSGWVLDRFRMRLVNSLGALLIGISVVLVSRISHPGQLYLLYGLMGVGISICGPIVLGHITRWFTRKRGIALGIASSGTSVGLIVGPPLANLLMTTYGWRNSFVIMGFASCVLLLVCAFFIKRSPPVVDAVPTAVKPNQTDRANRPAMTLRQAVRSQQLYLIIAALGPAILTSRMVTVHFVPYAIDVGISPASAALAMGVVGVFSTLGRFVMGFFQDRIGARRSMVACLCVQSIFMLALPFIRSELMLFLVFAPVFGFTWGGEVPQVPALTARCFGLAAIGAIYGLVITVGNLMGGLGPIGAGYIFDLTGGYTWPFLAAAGFLLLSAYFMWRLRPDGNDPS